MGTFSWVSSFTIASSMGSIKTKIGCAGRQGGVYHISVDPLEADIRSLLALEARRVARGARSLPNLRASRESLLPPAPAPAPLAPAPAPAPAPAS